MSDLSTISLDCSWRIKQLRLYMRMAGPQMADHLGISYSRYKNFEYGFALPIRVALQICRQCPGVTLDWLYLGRITPMDHKLALDIAKARAFWEKP